MKSNVAKAAWCAMILFIIPTQTSNSINKAKKPRKHNETLDKNLKMSRYMTNVGNHRADCIMNDDAPCGPPHETLVKMSNDATSASRGMVRVNSDFESTAYCIEFASAETGNPRKRHYAEISDEPRKNACHDQSGPYGHDQTRVPSHNSSNADKSPKVTHSSHEQSFVDKHNDTSRSISCKKQMTDSQQMDDDTNVDNPSTKASTIPPVANVNASEKEQIIELKKTSDQACNNFESQTLNQTSANVSKDEPNTEQCSVERQDNEPSSKASITDTYTEEQFFLGLSKFIGELVNGCSRCEDELNNDNKCCKVLIGEQHIFEGIEFTVFYLHLQSYMFKLNYNGRDLVAKYIKYIPCCEDKIIVKAKHENIVEVYHTSYTEDRNGFFIVMEAMDWDLAHRPEKHPDRLKDIVKSVVSALEYLHSQGIVHCDLKLDNILVKTVEGKTVYKLCDFGSALFIEKDDKVEPKNYFCTEVYQAPEMFYEGYITQKADIWMLGHTIWYYIDSANIEQFFEDEEFDREKYEEYLESPEDCPLRKNRLDIINKCCTEDPESRASFETILQWCNESD